MKTRPLPEVLTLLVCCELFIWGHDAFFFFNQFWHFHCGSLTWDVCNQMSAPEPNQIITIWYRVVGESVSCVRSWLGEQSVTGTTEWTGAWEEDARVTAAVSCSLCFTLCGFTYSCQSSWSVFFYIHTPSNCHFYITNWPFGYCCHACHGFHFTTIVINQWQRFLQQWVLPISCFFFYFVTAGKVFQMKTDRWS